jgi:hypothetical protein
MARTRMMAKTTNTKQLTERGSGRNGGNDGNGDGNSGMTTGEDNDDIGQGGQQQWARTAMTMGKDNNKGKDNNSKDYRNNGKDDW